MKSIFSLPRVWLAAITLCLSYGGWLSLNHQPHVWEKFIPREIDYTTVLNVSHILLFLSLYGAIASVINVVIQKVCAQYKDRPIWVHLVSAVRTLKLGAFLVVVNLAIFTLGISFPTSQLLYQINHAATLSILGWFLFRMIPVGETLVLDHLFSTSDDSEHIRKYYTHIVIIKRILILLLSVMIGAAVLMSFEKVRAAGRTILTSAGVLATIVGFSARGLLESIFRSLQLAISQPVRLEDTVTVGGETGKVTSITLHHVVVTLSDRSQLIVPIGEFLDKIFRNWTRYSDDLLGTLTLSINANTPFESIREKFREILKASENWDQNVGEVNVSEFKNRMVELRFTVSAKNGRQLAKLKSEILEKLLEYMQANYPNGLIS